MYLAEIRVFNYKSFLDSGTIQLKPGFNILIGQNNAGKTALLEAMSLQLSESAHRGLTKSPEAGNASGDPRVLATVAVTREEWRPMLSLRMQGDKGSAWAIIPVRKKDFEERSLSHPYFLQQEMESHPALKFDFVVGANGNILTLFNLGNTKNPSEYVFWCMIRDENGWSPVIRESASHSAGSALMYDQEQRFKSSIYSFRAERMNVGISAFGSTVELKNDASNLPEVLNVLQSRNPARFRRYNSLVKRVFPQVEWISLRPAGNKQVELQVWSVDPETEREDLSFPLSESGTGISQVLAMLYVLVTSESPRTILIDEPNSFLHPGAVRALVEILREHPQHQYILSTHSSDLIAASSPSTLHILRRRNGSTRVESVDPQELRHFRTLLMEVGSRPSDVFGAEHVLWVEGPTEQLCFPLIARHFLKRPMAGVSIVGVLHTGDFDAKDTRSVFSIYERLTQQGSALMPPSVAFIFDRETRSDRDRQDLDRTSKGKIHFLGRRTYENYLLHPEAIAAVLQSIHSLTPLTASPPEARWIKQWLEERAQNPKYYGKAKSQEYLQDIDAPLLLKELFYEVSANSLKYKKVEHSLALTEWILAHAPEQLSDIGALLDKVMPVSKGHAAPSE